MKSSLAFTRCDRLNRPAEFSAIMAGGTRKINGCFELRHRRLPDAAGVSPVLSPRPRLGLIIPKRLARRAVLRNLIKRLAREAFRHARASLPPVGIILRLVKAPLKPGQGVGVAERRMWRKMLDELFAGVAQ